LTGWFLKYFERLLFFISISVVQRTRRERRKRARRRRGRANKRV